MCMMGTNRLGQASTCNKAIALSAKTWLGLLSRPSSQVLVAKIRHKYECAAEFVLCVACATLRALLLQEMQDALSSSEEEKNALKRQLAKLSKKYQQVRQAGSLSWAAGRPLPQWICCPLRSVFVLVLLSASPTTKGSAITNALAICAQVVQ